MPIDLGAAKLDLNDLIDRTVDLAKGLKDHLGRLVSMPGLARQRLDAVLLEIDKTFTAVDSVVAEHLQVALDPAAIDAKPNPLIVLSGPDLPNRIRHDRGHCHAIGEIYWKYLKGILDPLLAGDARGKAEVDRIFSQLDSADGDLFDGFEQVGSVLQERAKQALTFQLNGDSEDAKAHLREDAIKLIEMRQHLQYAHLTLVGIRNDFIRGMSPPPRQ